MRGVCQRILGIASHNKGATRDFHHILTKTQGAENLTEHGDTELSHGNLLRLNAWDRMSRSDDSMDG